MENLLKEYNKNKSIENRNKLVLISIPTAEKAAWKIIDNFRLSPNRYEEIYSDALISLIIAVEKYDPNKSSNFQGYIYSIIYFRLIDHYRVFSKCRAKKIHDIRIFSLDNIVNENDEKINLEDKKEDGTLQKITKYDNFRNILLKVSSLSEREKTILKLKYIYDMTLSEIGRVLGYSESRICQENTDSMNKIKDYFKKENIQNTNEVYDIL